MFNCVEEAAKHIYIHVLVTISFYLLLIGPLCYFIQYGPSFESSKSSLFAFSVAGIIFLVVASIMIGYRHYQIIQHNKLLNIQPPNNNTENIKNAINAQKQVIRTAIQQILRAYIAVIILTLLLSVPGIIKYVKQN